ncbi:MAG: alpha/beta fold hydrolase, partial [Candidatus Dormibacterales bacterium]
MLVTFLHGFGQRGRSWSEVISLLPAGPQKLAPDLRGPTMDDCLDALEAIWNGEASHLVGYSMGGRLALHAAARVPGRVLSVVTVGAHGGLEGAE